MPISFWTKFSIVLLNSFVLHPSQNSSSTLLDEVILESSDVGSTNFLLQEDGSSKIRYEQDFKDIELLIENILLEETHLVGNRGQTPVENYAIDVDQDRPLGLIKKGQQWVKVRLVKTT